MIGCINLEMKLTGKPSAGNPHAGFDVAGAGNQFTVRLVRHSQRKRGATDRPDLRSAAPVLDPTDERGTETGLLLNELHPRRSPGPSFDPIRYTRYQGILSTKFPPGRGQKLDKCPSRLIVALLLARL